jgi:hypothetical protein
MLKRLIIISLLSGAILSCTGQHCKNLPTTFSSYSQAITLVQSSTFKVQETANTASSSWITSANYYSCDGKTGYLIYTTNRGYQYIHKGVPIEVWEEFKNAPSKGSYYNQNIKHSFTLHLL